MPELDDTGIAFAEEGVAYTDPSLSSTELRELREKEEAELENLTDGARKVLLGKDGFVWGQIGLAFGSSPSKLNEGLWARLEETTDIRENCRALDPGFDPFAPDLAENGPLGYRVEIISKSELGEEKYSGRFSAKDRKITLVRDDSQEGRIGIKEMIVTSLRGGRVPWIFSTGAHEVAHGPLHKRRPWEFLDPKLMELKMFLNSATGHLVSEALACRGMDELGFGMGFDYLVSETSRHPDIKERIKAEGARGTLIRQVFSRVYALGALGVKSAEISERVRKFARRTGRTGTDEGVAGVREFLGDLILEKVKAGPDFKLSEISVEEGGQPTPGLVKELVSRDEERGLMRALRLKGAIVELAMEIKQEALASSEGQLFDFEGKTGASLLYFPERSRGRPTNLKKRERLCLVCNLHPGEPRVVRKELPPGSRGEGVRRTKEGAEVIFKPGQSVSLGVYEEETGFLIPHRERLASEKEVAHLGEEFLASLGREQQEALVGHFLSDSFDPCPDIYDSSQGKLQLWLFNHFSQQAPGASKGLEKRVLGRARSFEQAELWSDYLINVPGALMVQGLGARGQALRVKRRLAEGKLQPGQFRERVEAFLQETLGEAYEGDWERRQGDLHHYLQAGLGGNQESLEMYLQIFGDDFNSLKEAFERVGGQGNSPEVAERVLSLVGAVGEVDSRPFSDLPRLSFSLNLTRAILFALDDLGAKMD